MITRRFFNLMMYFGATFLALGTSYYAFYPLMQEKRLLSLLHKLDKEKRYEEMKEVMKSPYLKNHTFIFKDETAIKQDNIDTQNSSNCS